MPDSEKVVVALEITVTVEVDNAGYLSLAEPVNKHIQKAKDDAQRSWQVLIKQGATEAKPYPSKVKVKSVTIIPSER